VAGSFPPGQKVLIASAKASCSEMASNNVMHDRNFMIEEEGQGITPEQYLADELPLLDQYLRHGLDRWDVRVRSERARR
jgi:hypothetical protein